MKRKCGTCYWFDHKFEVGDVKFSCSELATIETDDPCGDYTRSGAKVDVNIDGLLSNVKEDIAEPKKKEDKNADFHTQGHKEIIFEIISDAFKIEQDVDSVVDKVLMEIERQGYYLPFNQDMIYKYSGKLMDLFILYRMSLSMGMGYYIDDIMKYKIESLFADPRKFVKLPEAPTKKPTETE